MLQNEYRQKNKDSEFITDFSVLADKRKIENHLFFNFSKKMDVNNFETGDFQINIEQASNDTYLRANKLTSPIIKSTDTLENYFKINSMKILSIRLRRPLFNNKIIINKML